MELNEYQKRAMSTCTDTCNNYSYMMNNLQAEVGEFAGKIAKHIRKGELELDCNGDVHFIDIDSVIYHDYMRHLMLEAGDILWQLSGLCQVMGWDLQRVADANLEKLASRAERGKIIGDGDDR